MKNPDYKLDPGHKILIAVTLIILIFSVLTSCSTSKNSITTSKVDKCPTWAVKN